MYHDNGNKPMNVLIIGGGIAGPALSLFLKKAGFRATVYEAYSYKRGIGGGLNLAPNGMNVLDALGLAERVKAAGSPALEMVCRSQEGRVLAQYDNGSTKYGQPSVSLLRPDLAEILLAEMKAQSLPVEYEKVLTGIEQTRDSVIAKFADGTMAEGDLLIGADGIHSATRKYVLPSGPSPQYIGIVSLGGVVPGRAVPDITKYDKERLNFTFGQKGFFGYCGARGEDVMWWSNLGRENELSKEELADLSIESIKREMLSIYGEYHAPIAALLENTGPAIKINIYDIQSLPVWHKGRVLLMGDAAHAVSPNAGQGASMALEDSMYLAKLLRDARGDYAAAFLRFEKDRKPRAERIVAEGRRRGSDKKAAGPLEWKIKKLMITIFLNLFGERSLDWLYRYKIVWDEIVI